MIGKPTRPYPLFLRRVFKKILPSNIYANFISRHEHYSLRIWKTMASRLAAHNVILDIGAFHGNYALAARSVNRQVLIYAFEPNPLTAATLKEKCEGVDIHIEECAVTRSAGLIRFSLCSAMSHIANDKTPTEGQYVQVHAISLDDWAAEHHNPYISLVKIDVEGAESEVLSSAKSTFTKCLPVILCEVLSNEAGQLVMDALPSGYLYYRIDENRGLSQRPVVTRDKWRDKNWLFLHSAQIDLVKNLS